MFKNISLQAIIASVSYFIFIMFIFSKNMKPVFLPFILLSGFIMSFLIGYDINCLTLGNCATWSWIRAISIALGTSAMVFYSGK